MQCSKSDVNMEDVASENSIPSIPAVVESQDVKASDSADNFQSFMYELFEKNGVINDLRAYLRGHIVGVLRSAQTGDPPACQKHFTQRLSLPFQALNMLIAEYLLRLEFNYTLSLFVSEIPLANMVFAFAKSLMQVNCGDTGLRFKDEDMWSILNYLGIKCDSDHALNITEMYTKEKDSPLLLCMLKCMPLYNEPSNLDIESSRETLTSSVKSSDTLADNPGHRVPSYQNKCKHYLFCKTCQNNLLKIKDKYKRKKKDLSKNLKESSMKPLSVESVLKNVDSMERGLIDEMFQQLKSVYEAEMEMIKNEEEQRVKKSLATHALQLQKTRVEMEEKFKAREIELEHNVRQKKRFLWGLARLLREQHQHMARAMQDVRNETSRLSEKEDSFKSQLAEAEQLLRQRGEGMRLQISGELAVLEGHLAAMKEEQDSINQAREELESVKCLCDNTAMTPEEETKKEDLRSHYDLLKNEFVILKKYLETAKLEPKCVIERGTLTDMADVTARIDGVLNNGHDVKNASNDKLKVNQVVNDFKKLKNVNFSQSNLDEIYRDRSRSTHSRSTVSSDAGEPAESRGSLQRLKEENERLRTFARQQRDHIDELSSQQARLQSELTSARLPRGAAPGFRPRTAPTTMPQGNYFIQRMSGSVSSNNLSYGWRKGAGEELSLFALTPRGPPPAALPFVGARDRRPDSRRFFISQWRSLRRRASPAGGVGKRTASPLGRDFARERANSAGPSVRLPAEEDINNNENEKPIEEHHYQIARDQYEEQRPKTAEAKNKREKSPKSVLKEAKERLRSKDCNSKTPPVAREKSPNSVLRDAKLRLRKLEIEAEAVEKSYLDFRRKQEVLRGERRNIARSDHVDTAAVKDKDLVNNRPPTLVVDTRTNGSTSYNRPLSADIGKYINEYAKISETHLRNKNASAFQVKPIPVAFSTYVTPPIKERKTQNYLETSLTEFRKYYLSEKRVENDRYEDGPSTDTLNNENLESSSCVRLPTFINTGIFEDRKRPRSSLTKYEEGPKTTHNKNRESSKNECPSLSIPTSPGTIDVTLLTESQVAKSEISDGGNRIENIRKVNDKVKELEILKENINKIYNLSANSVAENNERFNEVVGMEWKVDNERNNVLDEIITEVSRDNIASESESKVHVEDKNLLRIELENVNRVHDVKMTESQTQDLLLVVESSIDSNNVRSDVDFNNDIGSTQMTILVTPTKSNDKKHVEVDNTQASPKSRNSDSGEKAIKISGHDILNSIYQAAPNDNISSVQMQLDLSKEALEHTISELEGNDPDYADDFSADVDNFNSPREDTDQSPISMPKTSEDENFWDS